MGGEHFRVVCLNAGAGNTRAQHFKVVRKIVVYAKADFHPPGSHGLYRCDLTSKLVHLGTVGEACPGLCEHVDFCLINIVAVHGDDIGTQHAAIECIVELSAVMYGFNQFSFAKTQVD